MLAIYIHMYTDIIYLKRYYKINILKRSVFSAFWPSFFVLPFVMVTILIRLKCNQLPEELHPCQHLKTWRKVPNPLSLIEP